MATLPPKIQLVGSTFVGREPGAQFSKLVDSCRAVVHAHLDGLPPAQTTPRRKRVAHVGLKAVFTARDRRNTSLRVLRRGHIHSPLGHEDHSTPPSHTSGEGQPRDPRPND